jgi:hypothetical protein
MRGSIKKTAAQTTKEINASRWMGPDSILVIYRVGDTVGQQVAEYYQSVRGIPAANVIGVTTAWTPTTESMTTADANNLLPQIIPHYKGKIRAVLTCHWFPKMINGTVFFSNFMAHALAFNALASGSRYVANLGGVFMGNFKADYPADNTPMLFACASDRVNFFGALQGANTPYGQVPPADYLTKYVLPPIPHFRLEAPPVEVGDNRISNASEFTYLKRIIDSSITAEAAKYADFGTVLLSGSGSYCDYDGSTDSSVANCLSVAIQPYYEFTGIPYRKLYYNGLRSEILKLSRNLYITTFAGSTVGATFRTATGNHLMKAIGVTQPVANKTAAAEPTWNVAYTGETTVDGDVTFAYLGTIPADSFPVGATALSPGKANTTFVNQTDVFFRAVGTDSYYNRWGPAREVEMAAHFQYRTGAIALFSQSLSAIPTPLAAIDYEFGSYKPNAMAATNCYGSAYAGLNFTNKNGIGATQLEFNRIGTGATTATVEVSSGNVVTLKTDGVTTFTIDLSAGSTLRAMLVTVKAAIASDANWSCTTAEGCISRSDVAVRNGTVAYLGSCAEPGASGATQPTYFAQNLWGGLCLGEIAYTSLDVMDLQVYTYIVGDPLYRPFGHRR